MKRIRFYKGEITAHHQLIMEFNTRERGYFAAIWRTNPGSDHSVPFSTRWIEAECPMDAWQVAKHWAIVYANMNGWIIDTPWGYETPDNPICYEPLAGSPQVVYYREDNNES